MSLRERLRRLRPGSAARPAKKPGATEVSPPTRLPMAEGITARAMPTDAGPVWCFEQTYAPDHAQGNVPIGTALQVPAAGWRRLMPLAKNTFPVADALFIDLETTGLGRGAGTYAFLVGVGRFAGTHFRLRQFFLGDYDEEPAVLAALQAELATAKAIVSFNGRSFDWPLLETRATMNRVRLPRLPHLDLLPTARRLWGPLLESCRLTNLEHVVLDMTRHDDVDGAAIPQTYFAYLQDGDTSTMADVITHNEWDILSMVALAGYVGQTMAAPRTAAPGGRPLSGSELFTFGRTLLGQDHTDEAIACFEAALTLPMPAPLQRRCQKELAAAYKKVARLEDALAVWHRLAAESTLSPKACIELAKHYEHRAKDLATARQWTIKALDIVHRRRRLNRRQTDGGSGAGATDETAAIRHRLARLERKIARRRPHCS